MEQKIVKLEVSNKIFAPKYCTDFSVALLNSSKITLTASYSEGGEIALCERLITDKETAERLHTALGRILEANNKQ